MECETLMESDATICASQDRENPKLEQNETKEQTETTRPVVLPAKLAKYFCLHDVLGDGSYGVVHLIYSKRNVQRTNVLALKIIDLKKAPSRRDVYNEVYINQCLVHKNLVKMYGHILTEDYMFVLNEYVSRGELFDYIKPECGVGKRTHKFLRQILDGIEYMHQRGFAHRDIKPENIMIDDQENLKIGDFGLSAQCVYVGKERPLCKNCGTAPYVAPEVFERLTYFGFAADVWSIGVVWVAMLIGELPWEKPDKRSDTQYQAWVNKKLQSPWERIPFDILTIVRKVLCPDPAKRLTIPEIRAAISQLHLPDFRLNPLREKVVREIVDGTNSHSQKVSFSSEELDSLTVRPPSFSQPLNQDMLLSQTGSAVSAKAHLNRLIYRMTRFYAKRASLNDTKHAMKEVLEAHRLSYKMISATEFSVSATGVEFRINLYLMHKNNNTGTTDYLVEFRRSSGDGLRFKRIFAALKSTFSNSYPGIYLGVTCFDNNEDIASQENDLSLDVLDDISKAVDAPLPEPGTPESFRRGFAQYQLKYTQSLMGKKRFRSPETYAKILAKMCSYRRRAVKEHDAKHRASDETLRQYEIFKRKFKSHKRNLAERLSAKAFETSQKKTKISQKFLKHPGLCGSGAVTCGLMVNSRNAQNHSCYFHHEKDMDCITGESLSSLSTRMKVTRDMYQKIFRISLRNKQTGGPKLRNQLTDEERDIYFHHFWSKPENLKRAPTEELNLLHFIDLQFSYRICIRKNNVYTTM